MPTASSLLSRLRAIYSPASRAFANRTFSISPSPIPQLRPFVSLSKGMDLMFDSLMAAARRSCNPPTTSSIQDPSPDSSKQTPDYSRFDDGLDYEHWFVSVEKPDKKLNRNEIIDSYIKILAQVIGSEEEARMKIYSVSTRHYFAFGALVSVELAYKIKDIPGVRSVIPDSYLMVRDKDYGGEPFINGQAVPYDPKYHDVWALHNFQSNIRPKRRPDYYYYRSRNFEK